LINREFPRCIGERRGWNRDRYRALFAGLHFLRQNRGASNC